MFLLNHMTWRFQNRAVCLAAVQGLAEESEEGIDENTKKT